MKKVAIQGIETSFHDIAAHKFFGDEISLLECETFKQTCEAVKTGQADYAVMAIENTIAGSLLPNFFLLKDYKLKIVGEVYLHIKMNLLALPGVKMEDIKTIQSHPIAIRQCADFLEGIKNVEILEQMDTAACARDIVDNQKMDTAAVANEKTAGHYGLEILEKRIETHKKNFTRFLILTKEGIDGPNTSKATVSFELGHEVGSLAKILQVLADHSINMTLLQSIPIIGRPKDYSFHVDITWDDYKDYETAMGRLLKIASNLTIHGEYVKSELNS